MMSRASRKTVAITELGRFHLLRSRIASKNPLFRLFLCYWSVSIRVTTTVLYRHENLAMIATEMRQTSRDMPVTPTIVDQSKPYPVA